jgi:hypothetical protein
VNKNEVTSSREIIEQSLARTGSISAAMTDTGATYETVRKVWRAMNDAEIVPLLPKGKRAREQADMDQPGSLSSYELMDYAGITYRQLDFWTRADYLIPIGSPTPGHGYNRRWTEEEAQIATVAKALIDAGFSAQVAIQHSRRLAESGPFKLAGGLLTVGAA